MVQYDEVAVGFQTRPPQMVGAGQTRLSGADDHYIDVPHPKVVHVSTNSLRGGNLPLNLQVRTGALCHRPPESSSGAPPGADAGRPFTAGTPSSGEAGTCARSPRAAS